MTTDHLQCQAQKSAATHARHVPSGLDSSSTHQQQARGIGKKGTAALAEGSEYDFCFTVDTMETS